MRKGLLLAVTLLFGCGGDPGTGPGKVHWDRDDCTRCRMVLSDQSHSAQVRGGPAGAKSRIYHFDDIGCAVIWLDEQPWKDEPTTEIWVTDHRDGRWIDARHAYYVPGQRTPMEYGLGAQDSPAEKALNFEEARRSIYTTEAEINKRDAAIPLPQENLQ